MSDEPERPPADLAIVNCTALLAATGDRTTFAPGSTIEITNGKFTVIDPNPQEMPRALEVIDARGMVAMPSGPEAPQFRPFHQSTCIPSASPVGLSPAIGAPVCSLMSE